MELYRFSFDDIFVGQAIAEEVVLVGSSDYTLPNSEGRMTFLTPIPGILYYCYIMAIGLTIVPVVFPQM